MTKKSFNLYFKNKGGEPKPFDSKLFNCMDDLNNRFKKHSKMTINDKSNKKLTIISIGTVKLYKVLISYFENNIKFVDIFIEEFKVEKF